MFIKNTAILAIMIAGLSAQSAVADSNTDSKNINVVSTDSSEKFDMKFHAGKKSYSAGEAIDLHVEGSREFFLYVYSQNTDGSYTLILPNKYQKDNKYPAKSPIGVPNKNLKFVADGASPIEHLYAIGSTRYIDINKAKSNKSAGDFKVIEQHDMESEFASKGINIRNVKPGRTQTQLKPQVSQASTAQTKPKQQDEVVLIHIELPILKAAAQSNQNTPPAADTKNETPVIVFISSDKEQYNAGDMIHFAFGATKAGTVEVFFEDPAGAGAKEAVLKQAVESNKLYPLSATHDGLVGEHTLRAIFSPSEKKSQSKALSLNNSASQAKPMASHTINVK